MVSRGKPRPAFLKALGDQEPPPRITIDGVTYEQVELLKHDSWAATARYGRGTQQIVCKFNRQQSLFGLPMGWLGRKLARREAAHYHRLRAIPNVPALLGAVKVGDQLLAHAVAHIYIEGQPLGKNEAVPEAFDHQLDKLIEQVHAHHVAYVDLHKRENVIVGEDGQPYLIDFQVSWMAPEQTGWWQFASRWWLQQLQRMDRYHLEMHRAHHQRLRGQRVQPPDRPWWIKAHRFVAIPLRQSRRWLLVKLGIRKGRGHAGSEHFSEQAYR